MEVTEIKALIEAGMPSAQVQVDGDGYQYQATIIDEAFAGLSKVKRQQAVYQTLGDAITSGRLHALTINTFTPTEWEQKNG